MSSQPEELPLQLLTDTDVTVSRHPAPVSTPVSLANVQKASCYSGKLF